MFEWFETHEPVLWWLFAGSIVTFVASLVVVPMLLVRIPADYFSYEKRHRMPWDHWHPLLRLIVIIVKNAIGFVLVMLGILMLLTPGQGLITIVVGLLLMNYPGKYWLEKWIISRPSVLRGINWLRQRNGHPPLVLE